MIKKLAVVGAGGHGKVIADIAELLGFTVFFMMMLTQIKHILNIG